MVDVVDVVCEEHEDGVGVDDVDVDDVVLKTNKTHNVLPNYQCYRCVHELISVCYTYCEVEEAL